MTDERSDQTAADLDQVLEQLNAAVTQGEGSVELQKLAARLMLRLAELSKTISARVEEVAWRERARDRSQQVYRAESGMHFFATLTEEARDRLVSFVEAALPEASVEALASKIAKEAETSRWDVERLLQAIAYWQDFAGQSEDNVTVVASILADINSSNRALAASLDAVDAGNKSSPFMQHLKRLVRSYGSVGLTVKGETLANRHERKYSYAVVSTDIRPIFGGNIEAAPEHALLIHNLLINFQEGGASRMITIGLSSKDVVEFASVLNRAWSKDRTLRNQSAYKVLP